MTYVFVQGDVCDEHGGACRHRDVITGDVITYPAATKFPATLLDEIKVCVPSIFVSVV